MEVEAPTVHLQPSVDVTKMFENLSTQEATEMMLRAPVHVAIQAFPFLPVDQQNHVFPLLDEACRNLVFDKMPDIRQAELLRHHEAFMKSRLDSMKDINHPESFFYWMAAYNAEKSCHNNKTTFILTADRLMKFDFKPFKYQRKLMVKHVQCIADGILKSLMMFHPIVLAYIEDKNSLTVVDGQHRWAALKKLQETHPEFLTKLYVQVDAIKFPDQDEEIMSFYKYINTNVPIDPNKLAEELRYVALINKIKDAFGCNGKNSSIVAYTKDVKVPQHFVVDSWLKEELQYRCILEKMTEEQVVDKLIWINEHIKNNSDLVTLLTSIENRMCKRDNFYLGIQWPRAIDLLEK